MSNNQITIAIPTYNRFEKVKHLLSFLAKQKEVCCYDVLLIDNCSDNYNYADLLQLIPQVRIYRNKYNVGASSNIIRCFEYCETDWLWIVGDDDEIVENGLELVLNVVHKNQDVGFINFQSTISKANSNIITTNIVGDGLSAFINSMPNYSNTLLISSSLYNLKYIKPDLNIAYMYAYTMAPHLVILLNSLSQYNIKYLFSKEFLINWNLSNVPVDWDFEILYLNNYDIIEFINHDVRLARIFYQKMLLSHPWPSNKYDWYRLNTVFSEQQLWFKFKKFEIEHKNLLVKHYKLLMNLFYFIFIEIVRKLFKRPVYRIHAINYLRLNKRN